MAKKVSETISNKNWAYLKAQRFLLNYSSGFIDLFEKGTVRFSVEVGKVSLRYYRLNKVEIETLIKYQKGSRKEVDEMIYMIQDFVIDCYYRFERDGTPKKLKDISALLGLDVSSVDNYIQKIFSKIRNSEEIKGLKSNL